LIGIALKRTGVFKTDDEIPGDATHLSALWHISGGDPETPPDEIHPGDLVWFGKGDHDNDPMQHPFVYLGGGRILGPVPDGAADSSVQVIAIKDVPEKFAGWMHVDDLGAGTAQQPHPGDAPTEGVKITAALLPPTPAAQYDALQALVKRAGGTWDAAKGKINLVGVKSLIDRCLVSPRPDDWNDTLFAAFLDDDGNKCVLDLRASLNPGTDSNRVESWQLWEGSWKFKLGAGDSTSKALQPDGKVKGWEDLGGMGAPRPLDPTKPGKVEDVQPASPKSDDAAPADKPKPRDPVKCAPTDPSKPYVFDGAGKKLSLKFGMRMMKALLAWELKDDGSGCIFSTNGVVQPYESTAALEWPDPGPLMKIPAPGDSWSAYGMSWGATGATNGTGSQLAALFAACADGKLRIKGGKELDLVANTPVQDGIGQPEAFAKVWMLASACGLKDKGGKALFGGFDSSAPAWAMKYLGIGDTVGKWGDKAGLANVRIGDSGQWMAHNWLVGDLRYEVTLKGGVTVYVDQGCFAKGTDAVAMKDTSSGDKLTAEDCDWIETNEEEFEQRVKDFLASKTVDVDGESKDIDKITPFAARVFSSNSVTHGDYGTSKGQIYKKQPDGSWTADAAETEEHRLALGVSRGFVTFADENGGFGFARFYDNAGGAEWSNG
jgi:hypothetical protein